MKITIYELLGLIKDGKEPKKIKYNGEIWECNDDKEYSNEGHKDLFEKLFYELYISELINSEVEIIEESKEIEKIKFNGDEFYSDYINAWISKNKTDAYCEFLMNKINDLIDEIKNLKEK